MLSEMRVKIGVGENRGIGDGCCCDQKSRGVGFGGINTLKECDSEKLIEIEIHRHNNNCERVNDLIIVFEW